MIKKAAVQVDLDGLWTIYQYHGLPYELWPDAVFTQALPRFLDLFADLNISATFFVVGVDATVPEKIKGIKAIQQAGHEVANHSYSHYVPLRQLDDEKLRYEMIEANQQLQKVTGETPKGFRSPAYEMDERIWSILEETGMQYDASIFPITCGKLMTGYERMKSRDTQSVAKGAYGNPRYQWAPRLPYHPNPQNLAKKGNSKVLEIPVSVFPGVRLPIHRSVSQFLGDWYWKSAVKANSWTGNVLTVLFHGVELVDRFSDKRIPEFKWVTSPFPQRLDEIRKMLKLILKEYEIVHTCEIR